jgi:hypothetical protein
MQLKRWLWLAVPLVWLESARAEGGHIAASAPTEMGAYSDTDHVAVLTPSVSGHVEDPGAGWSLDGTYLVDVISAASVDIVSTASSRWTEVRQAGDARASYKPADLGATVQGSVSSEPDYLAYAAGGYITRDLDQRNVSLVLGYGYGRATVGRTGTPFSVYSHSFDHHVLNGGITTLLDRRTVLAVSADVTLESGDSSKPYRYVPLFAADVAPSVPAGASLQQVTSLRLAPRILERLPLSRDRFGVTARLARRLVGMTVRVEGALYTDSWGLKSFSGDGRCMFDLGSRWAIGPHVRYYVQAPVSFWKLAYVGTSGSVPAFRTGDRELGPLMNLTAGARARWNLGPPAEVEAWSLNASFDAIYTGFLDDLYITRRVGLLSALTLEASW